MYRIRLVLLILLLSYSVTSYSADSSFLQSLSVEEHAWLKSHPVIRIGIDASYAPYSYIDESGHYVGVAPDILALLASLLDIQFKPMPNLSWPEILENTRLKKLDMIATAVKTPERESYLLFSNIYIPTPLVIMTRSDDSEINSAKDFAGKRIALVKDYSSSKKVITDIPGIVQHWVNTPLEGLSAVSDGSADAYVGVIGVNHFLASSHGITNLKISAAYDKSNNGQRFAIRNDWKLFAEILKKALQAIPEKEKLHIFQQWLPIQFSTTKRESAIQSKLNLSQEETAWLSSHPMIKIGIDPNWPPFEFINDSNKYDGMSAGYIALLSKRLNIQFMPVKQLTWPEVLLQARSKKLDVLPAVMKSAEREAYLNFTRPYLNYPMVIITRLDSGLVGSLKNLQGKEVAVVKDYVTQDILRENHPYVKIRQVNSVKQGLLTLLGGDVDAYVGNMAAVSYTVNRLGLVDLKVAGTTSYSYPLSLGVRKDWPILLNILNKTLDTINIDEANAIQAPWTSVHVQQGVNIEAIAFWSSIVGFVILTIFSSIFYWNRRLSLEIRRRNEVEHKLLAAKNTAEKQRTELAKAKRFLQLVLDNSPAGIIIVDAPDGDISYVNQAAWQFVGIDDSTSQSVSKKDYTKLWKGYYPNGLMYEAHNLPLARALQTGAVIEDEEMLVKLIDGSSKWASAGAAPILDSKGKVVSGIIVFIDISRQKAIEAELSIANEELAAANCRLKELDKLKSMFIASVSHELRTPLNSIIGFSGMMQNESFGKLNDKYRDYINRVNNSGKHLLSLITDIIDISKIESGRIETIVKEIQLKELVDEAIKVVKSEADKKNIKIVSKINQSVYVNTDKRRLLQCLLNFLSNAVKYSEKGPVNISLQQKSNKLRIVVSDSGIGVEKQDIPRLFTAFERIDTHLRVKAGGTGLGLYLTKKIATELLHGQVGVSSQYGKGSDFWIELPYSQALDLERSDKNENCAYY